MSKKEQKLEFEHATIYQTNENCQVFTGPISGAIFAMPGSTVNQYTQGQNQTNAAVKEDVEDSDEEPAALKPHFFKSRLFDSNERLQMLRTLLAKSMDMGEYNTQFGGKNEYTINPTVQGEWYYVIRAIKEAEVSNSFKVTEFIEMMLDWFPCLCVVSSPDDVETFKRRIAKSISHERGLWKYGKTKEDTCFKDMWVRRQQLGIDSAKLERVYNAAYTGLSMKLKALKHEIEMDNNKNGTIVKR